MFECLLDVKSHEFCEEIKLQFVPRVGDVLILDESLDVVITSVVIDMNGSQEHGMTILYAELNSSI